MELRRRVKGRRCEDHEAISPGRLQGEVSARGGYNGTVLPLQRHQTLWIGHNEQPSKFPTYVCTVEPQNVDSFGTKKVSRFYWRRVPISGAEINSIWAKKNNVSQLYKMS